MTLGYRFFAVCFVAGSLIACNPDENLDCIDPVKVDKNAISSTDL